MKWTPVRAMKVGGAGLWAMRIVVDAGLPRTDSTVAIVTLVITALLATTAWGLVTFLSTTIRRQVRTIGLANHVMLVEALRADEKRRLGRGRVE